MDDILTNKEDSLIMGNWKHYDAVAYNENLWEVMMKLMPLSIKTGNKIFDRFFLSKEITNEKIIEMNYTDEETQTHIMISFITDYYLEGFTNIDNMIGMLNQKTEIVYFDINRRLNTFLLMSNLMW
jgi:hypothetical protein